MLFNEKRSKLYRVAKGSFMKKQFALAFVFVILLIQLAHSQCPTDSVFREYRCLYPEMLYVEDSVVNINIPAPFGGSLKYHPFMFAIENNQINQQQNQEGKLARNLMWAFTTHNLTINCLPFTGSIRIAQKYQVWGVENRHSGYAILEIQYEKGKIIHTEKIPDPLVNPHEIRKMW